MTCFYCDQPHHARGMCRTHYSRWRRTGTPHRERWHGRWVPLVWFAAGERIMTVDELAAAIDRLGVS